METNCRYVVLHGTPMRSGRPLFGNTHPRGVAVVSPGQITLYSPCCDELPFFFVSGAASERRVRLDQKPTRRTPVPPTLSTSYTGSTRLRSAPNRSAPVMPVELDSSSFSSSRGPWSNTLSAPSRSVLLLPLCSACSLGSSEKVTSRPSARNASMARAAVHTESYAASPYALRCLDLEAMASALLAGESGE